MKTTIIKTDYTIQLADLLELEEDYICETVANYINSHPYTEEGDSGYFSDYFDEAELYQIAERLQKLNVNVALDNIALIVENLKFKS